MVTARDPTQCLGIHFSSEEPICKIVNGEVPALWENCWIKNNDLKKAIDVKKIIVGDVSDANEVIQPSEIELFKQNAWAY